MPTTLSTADRLMQSARSFMDRYPSMTIAVAYRRALADDRDLAERHHRGDDGRPSTSPAVPLASISLAMVDPGEVLLNICRDKTVTFAEACRLAPVLSAAWHRGEMIARADVSSVSPAPSTVSLVTFRAPSIADEQMVAGTIRDVVLFKAGRWNGREYSLAALDNMVAAYPLQGFKAPLKLGHSDEQELAHGYVSSLRREGDKLIGDIMGVPPETMALIRDGRLLTLSAEIYFRLERDGLTFPHALRAVAFLGANVPGVSGLPLLSEQVAA